MLYEPNEIKISETQLEKIFKQLESPICLMGGWATYYLVNKNFEKYNGRRYIGSRDIDIGFHIDKDWTKQQLEKSKFITSIRAIEKMGFRSISFRLAKDFDLDTGRELTEEESARTPLYRIFRLFIDPVVDHIHPKIKDILGFVPIDEPFLSNVFQEKMFTATKLFGTEVLFPKPHMLLTMKLNSAPQRDKQHKKIKDIADIFALLWYSDTKLTQLKEQLNSVCPEKKIKEALESFSKEDISRVSAAIGISSNEISRVLRELV